MEQWSVLHLIRLERRSVGGSGRCPGLADSRTTISVAFTAEASILCISSPNTCRIAAGRRCDCMNIGPRFYLRSHILLSTASYKFHCPFHVKPSKTTVFRWSAESATPRLCRRPSSANKSNLGYDDHWETEVHKDQTSHRCQRHSRWTVTVGCARTRGIESTENGTRVGGFIAWIGVARHRYQRRYQRFTPSRVQASSTLAA